MNQPKKERFKTSVGGQALMEGIMMRGPKQMCCAVRKPDGTIETKLDPTPAHGVWMKIPLVRGAIAMIESMIVGYRYMMYSAQVSMGDDYDPAEEETAFEKWVGEHLGEKAENALLTVAAVLGGLLALVIKTFSTGARSEDLLGTFICAGIGGALMAQIAVNVGMNLRVLPVIGVTLPFYSAGGSSVLILYICVGLARSVYTHNTKKLFG